MSVASRGIGMGVGVGMGVSVPQIVDGGYKHKTTHRYGMTMLAIIPQSELVQMPIPTVFERSLADETSAKMTYPSGPLFVFGKEK